MKAPSAACVAPYNGAAGCEHTSLLKSPSCPPHHAVQVLEEPLPVRVVHQAISEDAKRLVHPKPHHVGLPEAFLWLHHQHALFSRVCGRLRRQESSSGCELGGSNAPLVHPTANALHPLCLLPRRERSSHTSPKPRGLMAVRPKQPGFRLLLLGLSSQPTACTSCFHFLGSDGILQTLSDSAPQWETLEYVVQNVGSV